MVPLLGKQAIGILFLVATAAFAGCVGGNDPASDENSAPTRSSIDASSPYGIIRGSITDEELVPIEGAEVGLRETGAVTSTDASGYYEFADLDPGPYTVQVAKLGYDPDLAAVEVVAGEERIVDFRLTGITIPDAAYSIPHGFVGFYDCALGVGVWVSACSYPYTAAYLGLRDGFCVAGPACVPPTINLKDFNAPDDIQNNTFRYNFTVEPGAIDVVSEMKWQAGSAAAQRMQLILSCPNYDPVWDDCLDEEEDYAAVEGVSPLRTQWNVKGNVEPPAWVMARGYLPFIDIDGANPNTQVALSQRFEIWNTVFYNAASPEGYSLISEGS